MIIANPIYDVVFKKLMENDRVVKFFIGTLLEQTIESVEVKPQEFTYTEKLAGLAIFRLDFIATIKTENGEYKKVLIEIQKAKNHIDLMRFRNYLAEQYKKEDTVNNERTILPITTIYILGFKLPEIETSCIRVERNYKDLINKAIINKKCEFIEKLTHDSFIVQVDRITDRYQTRLDKLLSVFEQSNFIDDSKVTKKFVHKTDIEEVEIITNILHHSGTDPDERKLIDTEKEAWRTVNATFENERRDFAKALTAKDQVITEKDQVITEKDKALTEKDKVLTEKDKALTEKDRIIEELMRKLEGK
jgi:hypothetical protein